MLAAEGVAHITHEQQVLQQAVAVRVAILQQVLTALLQLQILVAVEAVLGLPDQETLVLVVLAVKV